MHRKAVRFQAEDTLAISLWVCSPGVHAVLVANLYVVCLARKICFCMCCLFSFNYYRGFF